MTEIIMGCVVLVLGLVIVVALIGLITRPSRAFNDALDDLQHQQTMLRLKRNEQARPQCTASRKTLTAREMWAMEQETLRQNDRRAWDEAETASRGLYDEFVDAARRKSK